MECVVDTCLCGLLFYAFGFAFMFSHGNGLIGYHWFFLQGTPATYETTGIAFLAVWLFQFAFADTCSTITSGAMIGRTGFVGDLLYSVAVSGFIYPIIGHWAWGPDGWLATMGSDGHFYASLGTGFHDFAGSRLFTQLADSSRWRCHRPWPASRTQIQARRRSSHAAARPHDCRKRRLDSWFGWYGFNPGSTHSPQWILKASDGLRANTTLAACAAGLTAMFWAYMSSKKWDAGFTTNGFLAD
jgi:Amt family ammonium transporter